MMRFYVQMFERCGIPKAETRECLDSLGRLREWTVARDLPQLYESLDSTLLTLPSVDGSVEGSFLTLGHIAERKRQEFVAATSSSTFAMAQMICEEADCSVERQWSSCADQA
eukprot:CAMPEP_0170340924 /NCGR_PEP_ID=MMETSP0116_2-20130129/71576_1 /TAXON_ID=400756 /ORGANISM="Durinskia baltica, Strain CSIRO CS-38" /LENGTH=111 /DNA_ID=CAMNT_0010594455 /DNA_START=162 /DNA_END=493 /DNA_ORIENTATION=-